jgi:hypothetical protein
MKRPSIDRVREVLSYNPETGELRWIAKHSDKIVPGQIAGSVSRYRYISVTIDKYRIYAHHIAWALMTEEWPKQIDHRDSNGFNNAWNNLRLSTQQQNLFNTKKGRGPLPKGVYKMRESYSARITVNRKTMYLGAYKTPELAHNAYVEAANKYFGEFARSA